ncbi:MAG TPA: ion channel [Solirubrobacterales bacterium]|nr:ion channel [Solirubrobacterales bacterium]
MDMAWRQTSRERWLRRAQHASDAFGLVLLLVLGTYALGSLVSNRNWGAVLLSAFTSATSIVALTSAHAKRTTVRRALPIAAAAVALALAGAISGGRGWVGLASLLEIGLLFVATGAVLRRVVSSTEVSFRTILGAVSVYAVLGILFTWAYGAIDRIEGGGFFEGVAHARGNDFIFFSYTTLTTTGYGNLVPAGHVGRMVAGLEMMAGQIFLVTLVAGLVALWRPGRGVAR